MQIGEEEHQVRFRTLSFDSRQRSLGFKTLDDIKIYQKMFQIKNVKNADAGKKTKPKYIKILYQVFFMFFRFFSLLLRWQAGGEWCQVNFHTLSSDSCQKSLGFEILDDIKKNQKNIQRKRTPDARKNQIFVPSFFQVTSRRRRTPNQIPQPPLHRPPRVSWFCNVSSLKEWRDFYKQNKWFVVFICFYIFLYFFMAKDLFLSSVEYLNAGCHRTRTPLN